MRLKINFTKLTSGTVAAYILFFAVACAPLPFGSYDKATVAFWCGVLGAGALAASVSNFQLGRGQLLLLGGIALIILGYAFVVHEQLADKPWIAPYHPLWTRTAKVLGISIQPSASIVRGESFFALGPTIASLLALICGLIVGTDRDRARQMLYVIASSGAAYAIYGILSFLIEPNILLWREKHAYIGSVTGPFVNHNTAAAYFGSCAAVWLIILLERVRRHLRMDRIVWKKVPIRILTQTPRPIILSFSMFFICLTAMFMTGSRAGVVVSLAGLIITFVIFFRRDLPPRSGIWVALGGSGLFALALLQFMGGVVSNRFDVQGLADEGRFEAYKSTIRIIADHPWFGTGLGTFAWSFPHYRSAEVSIWGVWDIAHSTPLELASEVGLFLAGAVALGWATIGVVLARGIMVRRRDAIVPLSAFSIGLIANVHSFIDFSLQIPGYSIVVLAITGTGLAQAFGGPPKSLDRVP